VFQLHEFLNIPTYSYYRLNPSFVKSTLFTYKCILPKISQIQGGPKVDIHYMVLVYSIYCIPNFGPSCIKLNFMFMWPCMVTNFFIIKPTRCTNFQNLLRHETLHVSGSSSVHRQEFIHCTLGTSTCHSGLKRALEQDQVLLESCLQTCMTCTSAECTVNELLTMDRGTARNM